VKVLFDQGTPVPLREFLSGHEVSTAYELGWSTLRNGELLAMADARGFQVFVTTDTNLRYQQNLQERRIAIVVLSTTSWPRIRLRVADIKLAIDQAAASGFSEVLIPHAK
jgi:hypothetical protein